MFGSVLVNQTVGELIFFEDGLMTTGYRDGTFDVLFPPFFHRGGMEATF